MTAEIIVIFIFYAIGWMCAYSLLGTVSYVLSSIYHQLNLSDPANVTNSWRQFVVSAFEWVGIDFYTEKLSETCIHLKLLMLMAFVACFGTLTVYPVIAIAFIAWITITLWTNFK